MNIDDKIRDIIDHYDGTGKYYVCISEIDNFMENDETIKEYMLLEDEDMYSDDCLNISYISVAYTTTDGGMGLCGGMLREY